MIRALFLAPLIALALLVAACGGGDSVDTTAVDVDALLVSAAQRMETQPSFHFDLNLDRGAIQILQGITVTHAEGDVAAPDRVHFQVEARAGPLKANLEMIVLPDGSWMTNPITGRWERADIDIKQFFDPADGVTATMRAISSGAANAEVAGTDTIDGVQTYRVEAVVDSGLLTLFGQPREGAELTLKAWIGVDDPLVYRIDVEGGILPDEAPDLVRTLRLSQFGENFDIQPPR